MSIVLKNTLQMPHIYIAEIVTTDTNESYQLTSSRLENHDAAYEHGVSNYAYVAQTYRLANLLTDPLSCILCVSSLQTTLSIIIIKPLLFQQKLEHIPALVSETGDVRCAWRSLRTSATNVKQHRVHSK
jgi:hypothetical protein